MATYMIHKVSAEHNVNGFDTYRVMRQERVCIAGFDYHWKDCLGKYYKTLAGAEKALARIRKPSDKVLDMITS